MELVVASTMMAVLFMGLGAHLRGGVAVWQRATDTTERLQRRRVALDRLERDLANSLLYDPRPDAYGEGVGLLPAPTFGGEAMAWVTVGPASPGARPAARFVTYRCDARDGVQGLWRTSQPIGAARAHLPPAPELLLPECEALTARYAALPEPPELPLQWRSPWGSGVTALPRLVEISLTTTSGEEARRIMAIPIGTLTPPPSE